MNKAEKMTFLNILKIEWKHNKKDICLINNYPLFLKNKKKYYLLFLLVFFVEKLEVLTSFVEVIEVSLKKLYYLYWKRVLVDLKFLLFLFVDYFYFILPQINTYPNIYKIRFQYLMVYDKITSVGSDYYAFTRFECCER